MLIEVSEEFEDLRIDKFLTQNIEGHSRTELEELFKKGLVQVNGEIVKKNYRIQAGESISVELEFEKHKPTIEPEDIPLDIQYEDEDLIVLNKPKGLVVHPGNGIYKGTLVSALLHHCNTLSDVNGDERPGIIHRLDKDTSGLLIVAKNNRSHSKLADDLQKRLIKRTYQCLVWGQPRDLAGTVDKPLARDKRFRIKMAIDSEGKHAVTHYELIKNFDFASLLRVQLETGRTHQIRVHMSSIGHPIVGDPLYFGIKHALQKVPALYKKDGEKLLEFFSSQALQAVQLNFNHPITDEPLEFSLPLENNIQEALSYLETHPKCR